jgi:CPA1 family monovalent cation:H+ antiporter
MGGYTLHYTHVSGPLAMVAAGLITMGKASMSDITAEYVDKFWELIDEILNALLFVLIGLELLIIQTNQKNCFRYYNSFYYACNKIYFGLYPSIAV